ncbi:max-binding protein MNT-like [Copidosoma floridanum]|uniref:max-binding protein MNT-like n=1 Tax=Copidosoma floridanum TaxID=29053 RepID=UPI0006C997BA|nr:max-binding protein MNT-like [Copidosoma floridanum]
MGVLLMSEAAYPRLSSGSNPGVAPAIMANSNNVNVTSNNNNGEARQEHFHHLCAAKEEESGRGEKRSRADGQETRIQGRTPPPPKKKWILHYLLEDELSEVNEHQAINGKSQKPLHSPLFTSSELVAGPEVSPTIANSPSQESTNPTNLVSSADIHRYHEHQQHEGVITSSHFIDSQHNSNSIHSLSSGSGNADNGPSEEKKSRSSNGVAGGFRTGTREVHNKLEKNRRAHLKECFDRLKATIPGMTNRKTSNLNVLKEAVTYTKHLRKQNIDYDRKMTEITRINIELQNKCKALKMKMSLQPEWQNVDLDKVFPIQDIDINVTHIGKLLK